MPEPQRLATGPWAAYPNEDRDDDRRHQPV